MSSPRIMYRPRPDATSEEELKALSASYAFILQAHQEKQKGGGAATEPDDEAKSLRGGKPC